MVSIIFILLQKRHLKLVLFFLLFFLGVSLHKAIGRFVFPYRFREQIELGAEYTGVDPELVAALIYVESKFNPEARSRKGARGLMQIMPETAVWLGEQKGLVVKEEDLDRPEINIQLGIYYLGYLFREFNGHRVMVLAAYNAGHEKVKRWLASGAWTGKVDDLHRIPYQETKRYVAKIMRTYYIYRYLYKERA